jgi:hypothetical protein
LSPYSLIGGINPAALMRCDLENTSHPFRGRQQIAASVHDARNPLSFAPEPVPGDSRRLSSPLVGDITHANREETDKHLSGPPDSMIASQGTETEAGLEISIMAAGNPRIGQLIG